MNKNSKEMSYLRRLANTFESSMSIPCICRFHSAKNEFSISDFDYYIEKTRHITFIKIFACVQFPRENLHTGFVQNTVFMLTLLPEKDIIVLSYVEMVILHENANTTQYSPFCLPSEKNRRMSATKYEAAELRPYFGGRYVPPDGCFPQIVLYLFSG